MLELIAISFLLGVAVFFGVRFGVGPALRWMSRQEQHYDRALRRQLMLDVNPRQAVYLTLSCIGVAFLLALVTTNLWSVAVVAGVAGFFVPHAVIRHLAEKRRQKLDRQLVDALVTLSAATRAGLNLVQAMGLVVRNQRGPVQQEVAQMLREYELGMDLNTAMRQASNRIGSPLYRLVFTALEMHRRRGGDLAESMDRIAESVRDIQRLEGRLDAVTAQSRGQAKGMAVMPMVFLPIMFLIDPAGVELLFTDVVGRLLLIVAVLMIIAAYVWIFRIMNVDL